MSITAMKQWLKALEHTSPLIDDVITAKASLRQAIEQAEKQKPVAWMTINAYGEEDDIHYENPEGHLPEGWTYKPLYTRPQPVAQMRMPKIGDRVICIEDESLATVESLTGGGSPDIKFDDGSHGTYLLREFAELFCYADTTPQPQREWVGLTDEEIDDLAEIHGLDFMSYSPFTRAIEAKLKEKNT